MQITNKLSHEVVSKAWMNCHPMTRPKVIFLMRGWENYYSWFN